jgi:hypothetical protein
VTIRFWAVLALLAFPALAGCSLFGPDDTHDSLGAALGNDLASAVGADDGGCNRQQGRVWWYCNVVKDSYDLDGAGGGRYVVDVDTAGCWKAWLSGERILQYFAGTPALRHPKPGDRVHDRAFLPVLLLVKRVGDPVTGCIELDGDARTGSGGDLAPGQLALPGTPASRRLCQKALAPSPRTTVPRRVWRNPRLRRLLCHPPV